MSDDIRGTRRTTSGEFLFLVEEEWLSPQQLVDKIKEQQETISKQELNIIKLMKQVEMFILLEQRLRNKLLYEADKNLRLVDELKVQKTFPLDRKRLLGR